MRSMVEGLYSLHFFRKYVSTIRSLFIYKQLKGGFSHDDR